MDYYIYNNELYHWGVKGMKWGVRRYQNKDGTLTAAGRQRLYEKTKKILNDSTSNDYENKTQLSSNKMVRKLYKLVGKERDEYTQADSLHREFVESADTHKYTAKAYEKYAKKHKLAGNDDEAREYGKEMASTGEDLWKSFDESGFKLFLEAKGVDPKKYMKNVKAAHEKYMKACERVVKEQLGDMGDLPVNEASSYKERFGTAIENALVRNAEEDWKMSFYNGYWYDT